MRPADLCSPNLSVISDPPSFWQLFGLKLALLAKFYKDKHLAKGLFCQLRPFIPQLPSGAHGSPCCLAFRNEEENVRPSKSHSSTQERQVLSSADLNTCPQRRRTCTVGLSVLHRIVHCLGNTQKAKADTPDPRHHSWGPDCPNWPLHQAAGS